MGLKSTKPWALKSIKPWALRLPNHGPWAWTLHLDPNTHTHNVAQTTYTPNHGLLVWCLCPDPNTYQLHAQTVYNPNHALLVRTLSQDPNTYQLHIHYKKKQGPIERTPPESNEGPRQEPIKANLRHCCHSANWQSIPSIHIRVLFRVASV